MGVVKLSILGGCATLALAAAASAAPASFGGSERLGLSTPVEAAAHCHRRHARRAARCCDDDEAAVVSEPVVVVEPAYFDVPAPVVVEEPVACCGAYAAPVAIVPVEPIGFGDYGYPAVVEVVVPSGDYCATPVKTCLLREPGVLGTGCSCHIPGGIARGVVE
jgi:hypothetical protein